MHKCTLVRGCQRVLGRQFFGAKEVDSSNARKGKLWCNDCTEKKKKEATRLEQQRALNKAEYKGVRKGGVKCGRPECAE